MNARLATIGQAARRILFGVWLICAVAVVVDFFTPRQPPNIHLGQARSGAELFAGFFLVVTHVIGQGLARAFMFYFQIFVLAVLFCWLVLRAVRQVRQLRESR